MSNLKLKTMDTILLNISTFNNYPHYQFGMLQPGMYSEAGTSYRFGFNGMLRDDEVKDSDTHKIAEYGLTIKKILIK